MRKIFTSFIAVLLTTICAVAQLPYNTVMTQSHFNDGNTKIASSGDNAWDGGVRLGGKSTSIFNPSGPAYNWDDKYIIIALSSNGIPHHLTCNTSTNSNATSDTKFYVATSSDNKTYTEKWSSENRDNTIDLELAKDVKYIKLCYSANFGCWRCRNKYREYHCFYNNGVVQHTCFQSINNWRGGFAINRIN